MNNFIVRHVTYRRRFLTFVFNFYSVISFSIVGNELKLSKVLSFKNISFLPLLSLIIFSFPSSSYYKGVRMEEVIIKVKGMTILFVASFTSMFLIYYFMISSCIYMQWWNREKVLNLINECLKFHRKFNLDNEHFKVEEQKLFKKFAIFLCLVLLLYWLEFFSMFHLNVEGILLFILHQKNGFIVLFFLFFIYCFLQYFIFVIQNLNLDLKNSALEFKITSFEQTVRYLIGLRNLKNHFYISVGSLLSLLVVCFITANVVRVNISMILKQFDVQKFPNFCSSCMLSQFR